MEIIISERKVLFEKSETKDQAIQRIVVLCREFKKYILTSSVQDILNCIIEKMESGIEVQEFNYDELEIAVDIVKWERKAELERANPDYMNDLQHNQILY